MAFYLQKINNYKNKNDKIILQHKKGCDNDDRSKWKIQLG